MARPGLCVAVAINEDRNVERSTNTETTTSFQVLLGKYISRAIGRPQILAALYIETRFRVMCTADRARYKSAAARAPQASLISLFKRELSA